MDEDVFKKKWNDYKEARIIRKNKSRRFWKAYLVELGLKKPDTEKAYVYVTPEERGVRAAKSLKSFFSFIKDFTVYCCKKIYNFFKWFINALMDVGDHFNKQTKKEKK